MRQCTHLQPVTDSFFLQYNQNFTSIVGPNGSGKSNVIDAFMFVLGYRAKKLRQSKLAELIHNSEGMLDVESCTVEVHFSVLSGDDNSAVERLVVSRTAHRNNTNKYFVNGHVSSYSDVIALLKSFGVDLDHKRFLILQVKFSQCHDPHSQCHPLGRGRVNCTDEAKGGHRARGGSARVP